MIINISIFILPFVGISKNELFNTGALIGENVVLNGELWRLFTAMFLHAGAMHIVMNMLSLYMLGHSVEPLFSRMTYFAIYIISGLFGGLVSIYFHPMGWGVGASGAIFGIFGALIGFAIVHRHNMGESFRQFIKEISILLVINLVIGLVIPNVDMSAHIGGLVVGFIGGYFVAKNAKYIWLYMVAMIFAMIWFYNYLFVLYPPLQGVLH